jgi:uncharacterized protein YkwD
VAVVGLSCVEPKNDADASETETAPNDSDEATDEGAAGDGEPVGMEGMIAAHNAVRAGVGVPDLIWDDALTEIAAEWAASLAADGCYLEHDYSSPYGENLYWSSFESNPTQVVDAWASEVAYYDYASNSCDRGEMCGHYTQLVWSTTERVGCAMVLCADNSEIWMCDYDPPGNYVGEWPY